MTALIDDANGGTLTHPGTGHSITFLENSVNQDTNASISLLPEHLPAQPHPDFQPSGVAFQVELGGARLTGEAVARIPHDTGSPQNIKLYWMLPDSLLVPLETSYDADTQTFSATLPGRLVEQLNSEAEFDSSILFFGLLDESGYLSRPDHVDWPSYNLYVFEAGSFVKYFDQGQLLPGRILPIVGDKPLMVVHGLGSNVSNFNGTVSSILRSQSYSTVYGFEYDTLSALSTSGPKLREAYSFLEGNTGRDWHHLAHSMGCVISRQAFENGGSLPYRSNNVVLAAGPHTGSPIINALQNSGTFVGFITFLVVNNVMDFRNADGTPCKVQLTDRGFSDLAEGSSALAVLNDGAAGRHPKETYRSLAGNNRGYLFAVANYLVGIDLDDGFVNVASANPGALVGTADSRTVPNNHLDITTDPAQGLGVILDFLSR